MCTLEDSFELEARFVGLPLLSKLIGWYNLRLLDAAGDARGDDALWFESQRPFVCDWLWCLGVLMRFDTELDRYSSGVEIVARSLYGVDSYGLKLDFCCDSFEQFDSDDWLPGDDFSRLFDLLKFLAFFSIFATSFGFGASEPIALHV